MMLSYWFCHFLQPCHSLGHNYLRVLVQCLIADQGIKLAQHLFSSPPPICTSAATHVVVCVYHTSDGIIRPFTSDASLLQG